MYAFGFVGGINSAPDSAIELQLRQKSKVVAKTIQVLGHALGLFQSTQGPTRSKSPSQATSTEPRGGAAPPSRSATHHAFLDVAIPGPFERPQELLTEQLVEVGLVLAKLLEDLAEVFLAVLRRGQEVHQRPALREAVIFWFIPALNCCVTLFWPSAAPGSSALRVI